MAGDHSLDDLVSLAAHGDEPAWQALWSAIEAPLSAFVARPRFLGKVGANIDDRRSIIVAVMARLRADGFARLRLYLEARATNPQLGFLAWLRVVAKRVGIDYLRSHPDYVRRYDADRSRPGHWIDAAPLPPASQLGGARPPITEMTAVAQLLAVAEATLTGPQLAAVRMWAQSESFTEIARALGYPAAADAEALVRAGLGRLRRHYQSA